MGNYTKATRVGESVRRNPSSGGGGSGVRSPNTVIREEYERRTSGGGGGGSAPAPEAPPTLAEEVQKEQERLAEKYPGYTPTEKSATNIARNIINYGTPISPSNRLPQEVDIYPGYTGPRPGPGDPYGLNQTLTPEYVAANRAIGAVAIPVALKGPSGVKLQNAINAGYTGYMSVPFGGGMAGSVVPNAKSFGPGLERLFYRRAVREGEASAGRSLRSDFSGFKEAADKVGINRVLGYREGSTLKVIEEVVEPKPLSREEQARQWRDLGVYGRQDLLAGERAEVRLKETSGAVLRPAGLVLNSVGVVPSGFRVGFDLGRGSTFESYKPDLSYLDAAESRFKDFGGVLIPGVGSVKVPILYDYFEKPLYKAGLSEFRAAETEKQYGLLGAKDEGERAAVLAAYGERLKGISDLKNIRVSLEGGLGPRYAVSRNPLVMVGEELLGRFNAGDLPVIDVKASPAAAAAGTGLILGGSVAFPVFRASTPLAGGYAAAVGVARIGATYAVGSEVRERSGSVGLGLVAGGVAGGVVGYGGSLLKARIAPFNRAEIISNSAKVTQEFGVGSQRVGATVSRDIYKGLGGDVPPRAIRGAYTVSSSGVGSGVGGELPVFVRLSNVLGEVKTVPTYSGTSFFNTRELGLGSSIVRESYLRRGPGGVEPAARVEGFVNLGKGLEVPAGAGYSLPGQPLGARAAVASQSVVSNYWVGSGSAAKLVGSAYRGSMTLENLVKGGSSRLDLFNLRGGGFSAEFGRRPSAAVDVSARILKSTKTVGEVSYGSELVAARVGDLRVLKGVPFYTEVTRRVGDVGGGGGVAGGVVGGGGGGLGVVNLEAIKVSVPGGSAGGSLPSLGGSLRGSAAAAASAASSAEAGGYTASILAAVGRGSAAASYVQGVKPSFSLGAVPLFSSGSVPSVASLEFKSPGRSSLVVESLGLGSVSSFSGGGGASILKQSVIAVPKQSLGYGSLSKVLARESFGSPVGSVQREELEVMQKQRVNQVLESRLRESLVPTQKQNINQILKEDQSIRQSFSNNVLTNLLKEFGGGGGGGRLGDLPPGFPPGRIPGFGDGGGGRSALLSGSKWTLRNPWSDAEEFASKVLGSKPKRRRKK